MRPLGTACLPLGIRIPIWSFVSTLPSVEKEKQQKVLSCPVFCDHPYDDVMNLLLFICVHIISDISDLLVACRDFVCHVSYHTH